MRVAPTFLVVVLAALGAAAPNLVSADAIRMRQCPTGWENRRVGHGAFCFPVVCTDNTTCPSGTTCQEAGHCWTRRMRPAGRRPLDPDDSSSWMWVPAHDPACTDTCPGAAECRQARECVPGAAPTSDDTPEPGPAESPADPPVTEPTQTPAEPPAAEPTHESSTNTEAPASESDDGGCSVGHGASPNAPLLALALVGLWLRRKR